MKFISKCGPTNLIFLRMIHNIVFEKQNIMSWSGSRAIY